MYLPIHFQIHCWGDSRKTVNGLFYSLFPISRDIGKQENEGLGDVVCLFHHFTTHHLFNEMRIFCKFQCKILLFNVRFLFHEFLLIRCLINYKITIRSRWFQLLVDLPPGKQCVINFRHTNRIINEKLLNIIGAIVGVNCLHCVKVNSFKIK